MMMMMMYERPMSKIRRLPMWNLFWNKKDVSNT
jgi:hypothetical protein